MGLFSKLNPQKIFDTAAGGIDKMFFTKEEKAEFMKDAQKQYLEYYKMTLQDSSVRGLTRRYIAVMFCAVFLLFLIAAAVAFIWRPDYAEFLFSLVKEMKEYIAGILIFYFGYYGITKIMESRKKSK